MAESQSEATSQSSARERYEKMRQTRTKTRSTPKTVNPTRVIQPGLVHHRVASGLLRGLRDRAQAKGLSLDIGELPKSATDATDATDDPERLERIVAHLVARIGDRFTFIRKFSRHMEGTENRAGMLADLFAALVELYKRNPDSFEVWGKQYAREVIAQGQARRAAAEAAKHNAAKASAMRTNGATNNPEGTVHAS